ncbi:hypothetical protein LCGC14_2810460 [marine sediment metagenome]|uniref:DUF2484 family protein n=1 Tax=marine sediment metagenome TaxID=412755 RepID=A0A0F8Z6U1_9ZZZZ
MTLSLVLAFVWMLCANVAAMLPSRRGHWPAAIVLIVIGLPLLGWVTVQNGPWIGLLAMAAGASVLRWPVIGAWRRLRRAGHGNASTVE